jgi:phage terminase large subunit-like protein
MSPGATSSPSGATRRKAGTCSASACASAQTPAPWSPPHPGRPGAQRHHRRPETVLTGGPTKRNPHNAAAFTAHVYARYAGTRLALQELEGQLLTDAPGALWTVDLIGRCRVLPGEPRTFTRLAIAVDPPSGDGTCGIVACARAGQGDTAHAHAHVLADHSVTARSPEGWARAVADAARMWSALHPSLPRGVEVVAESNQGGHMVRAVLHTADPNLKVKLVPAIAGKSDRAAPVAMLFEAGRATLAGRFPELEAELLGMIAGGGYEGPGRSPDRADAMVWGLTELMLQPERAEPKIRTF